MKFCDKPFNSLHLDPNGGCRLCGWTDITIGDLCHQSLEEVWNSEEANKVREAIKHGNYEYCRKTSCHFLENDSLPDLDEKEIETIVLETLPTKFSVACDFVCNHKCPSCRNELFKPDEEYKKKLSIILEKILPYLNRKETEEIGTDGNGDCFASPYIMLEQLRPQNKKCKISFETNGALLDKVHWDKIKHLSEYWIQVIITPNSFIKTTFEYLNGGVHSYNQVMNNLKFVKMLRKQENINWLSISIVLQERNFWELPEFVRRCLEEFAADEVVVKPIYKWFMLSEDDYWFKDVLNPQHPYHKEYLQMLDNPILDNPRVFFWGAHNLHESRKHPAYVYKEYAEMIDKLLWDSSVAKDIEEKLLAQNIKSVYLYGDTEVTPVFDYALKNTSIHIDGIIARYCFHEENRGLGIIPFEEYRPSSNDVIIIMNYVYVREITRDLHFKGFDGKIMLLTELME